MEALCSSLRRAKHESGFQISLLRASISKHVLSTQTAGVDVVAMPRSTCVPKCRRRSAKVPLTQEQADKDTHLNILSHKCCVTHATYLHTSCSAHQLEVEEHHCD